MLYYKFTTQVTFHLLRIILIIKWFLNFRFCYTQFLMHFITTGIFFFLFRSFLFWTALVKPLNLDVYLIILYFLLVVSYFHLSKLFFFDLSWKHRMFFIFWGTICLFDMSVRSSSPVSFIVLVNQVVQTFLFLQKLKRLLVHLLGNILVAYW